MKTSFSTALLLIVATMGYAQKADTVKVSLGETSRIIFTMEDPADLDILKHYNFQELFNDILRKLEDKNRQTGDSSRIVQEENDRAPEEVVTNEREDNPSDEEERDNDWADRDSGDDSSYRDDDDDDDDDWEWRGGSKWHKTRQSFNFDLGLNNFLEDGEFPNDADQYAVRPWGSWYVGIASVQRSRLARNFFLEWGLGINWYNFKFEDDNTLLVKGDDGVAFTADTRDVDFIKSKLSVSYIQASLIPVIDFNDRFTRNRFWDGDKNSFRIGAGPYVAYRIASHSKLVYDDGGRERDKERDSYYLNNLRYGLRLQVGYRSTDLFFNYDLNELFSEGKGPKVNAISFGVIF